MSVIPTGAQAKTLGAFYTDRAVADFLVRWTVRHPQTVIMDPSFGGGVFLEAALDHLQTLGGEPAHAYGVELDPVAHAHTSATLNLRYALPCSNLRQDDLFALSPRDLPPFDAIVGNPPYIRYQRFSGASRARALERAKARGVTLSRRASAWAAFLVHTLGFLKPGGRLGMVLPMELLHADYAQPVLEHLQQSFGRVALLTCRERLFPHLDQDTLLLLGEAKGEPGDAIRWRDHTSIEGLLASHEQHPLTLRDLQPLRQSGADTPESPASRLQRHLLSEQAAQLYMHLGSHAGVTHLGDVTSVGIGYVTGSNAFFHLSPEEVSQWRIPSRFLQRSVFRGNALSGVRFTRTDWRRAIRSRTGGYLLALEKDAALTASVEAYLAHGEQQRVQDAYKCRRRTPWYCVPSTRQPHAFLTSMIGARSFLVANEAGVSASNTLHVLHMKPGANQQPLALSVSWLSSLSRLSVELEGRVLGGGMLKLEPSDARRVLLAPPPKQVDVPALADTLDGLLRRRRFDDAQCLADEVLLKRGLGLSSAEVQVMKEAADALRDRRCR